MTSEEWIAAANECLGMAEEYQKVGNRECAAYWRRNAAALIEAARKAEQEQQHERITDRSDVYAVRQD